MNAPTINELKKIRKFFASCANSDCDHNRQPRKRMNMKLDTTTIIPFPTSDVWGTFYTKLIGTEIKERPVNSLGI